MSNRTRVKFDKGQKLAFRKDRFEAAVRSGVSQAAKLILKTSEKSSRQLKDEPVGELAQHLDDTLKVFVNDRSESEAMRFWKFAERIIGLIVEERSKQFSSIEDSQKIQRLGEAFGFMAGTAVMTSSVGVFVRQATKRLVENSELTQEQKSICISYINDALTVILMAMSSQLDAKYHCSKKERIFFSTLLLNNDWVEAPTAPEVTDAPAVTPSEPSAQS